MSCDDATSRDRGLDDPAVREIAMMLVSSAENSTLNWRSAYSYIEYDVEGNDAENRGYTAGIVGFTSRTSDLLAVVLEYSDTAPKNPLSEYIPALRAAPGSSGTAGLGTDFEASWREAARDPRFRRIQWEVAHRLYIEPATRAAESDGLKALGQFVYVDAAIMHGLGSARGIGAERGLAGIRTQARARATTPREGGGESAYLEAFLDERVTQMRASKAHQDVSRVETAQRRFLREGNMCLQLPLAWSVYGKPFKVTELEQTGY